MRKERKSEMGSRPKWIFVAALAAIVSALALRGCGSDGSGGDGNGLQERDFLVVVESSLAEALQPSLARYAENMQIANIEVYVELFEPGTVEELRQLLFQYIDVQGIEGALLIGDLPAAWYEQTAFGYYEQFPIDLYLQDRHAIWIDEDEDGRFDGHSNLHLDIYTARLHGTTEELVNYFARAYSYRWDGPLVDVSAFIFIDDDWSSARTEKAFHLEELYSNVDLRKEPFETTAEAYLEKMTGDGAEFVYQWMHASPRLVQFEHHPEGGSVTQTRVMRSQVRELNFKGSFYNLFNCSAARFTEEGNLARDYTVGTDYGLAAIGSTKTGAVARPHIFHGNLVIGRRWGEAYQIWYNEEGWKNDEWHLGIVIIGDPLLRLTGDLFPWGYGDNTSAWTPPAEVEDIGETMERIAEETELGTYEEYRERNPQFFD
ncbi:MAG: hypothetical protein WBM74_06765 [Polyangiales bacterium]